LNADFYAAAERRIWRFQFAIAALGCGGTALLAGPGSAAMLALGAAISILNFRWLKQGVDLLSEGATTRRRRLLVAKFLGRYLLMGGVAYGILKYTRWDVRALLAGLFVFVAAILAEIGWEIVAGPASDPDGT